MAGDHHPFRGIWTAFLTGAGICALACGFQALFARTVRVPCPPRTATAPGCTLRWLVAFDTVTVRRTPLPALQPVGELVPTNPGSRRGSASTLYLNTADGPVRTIMWGDQLSLQKELRDP